MKTGLGLKHKLIALCTKLNLFRFWLRKTLLGFDAANVFLQRLDKASINLVLRKNGAIIGKDCDIETGLIFHNCKDYSNLIIRNNCHVGKNCLFDLRGKVTIENNVVISMQTTFITHQDLNKSELKKNYPATKKDITIKNNCYIGANATILKGIVINEFAVVAAGAVVNNNVPKYAAVGGVPAILIKKIEKSEYRKTGFTYDHKT
jgi:acetyltransferase-like isoleucine patch superfamily enzyme